MIPCCRRLLNGVTIGRPDMTHFALCPRRKRRWAILRKLLFPRRKTVSYKRQDADLLVEWIRLRPSRLELSFAYRFPKIRELLAEVLDLYGRSDIFHRLPAWVFRKELSGNPSLAYRALYARSLGQDHFEALMDWVSHVVVTIARGHETKLANDRPTRDKYRLAVVHILTTAWRSRWQAPFRSAALLRSALKQHHNHPLLLLAALHLRVLTGTDIERHYSEILAIAQNEKYYWAHTLECVTQHPEVSSAFLLERLQASWSQIEFDAYVYREAIRRNPDVRARMLEAARVSEPYYYALLCREASEEELPGLMREFVGKYPLTATTALESPTERPRNLTTDALLPALTSERAELRLVAMRLLDQLDPQGSATVRLRA